MAVLAIIPAYQAAHTVGRVVVATRGFVPRVLVIDDGSSDGTAAEARAAGAEVLRFPANRGKGVALRAGFVRLLEDGGEAAVTLDADGQHDPSEIPRFLSCWRETGANLILGSRAASYGRMTPLRRFGNRFSRAAVSYYAGVPVPDPQTGYRLYDAAVLRRVDLRGARYEMESEVIVQAARRGFRVASMDIRLAVADGTATSHYRPWRDTARMCAAVVACSWRLRCFGF